MRNEYPRLKYLLSCYYHQDWDIEINSKNEKALWELFYDSESLKCDETLELNIATLLKHYNYEIHQTLLNFQSLGRYWETPDDAKSWLEELYEFVQAKNYNY